MRHLTFLLLFLLPLLAFGQINHKPTFYLNSKEIDWDLVFINPQMIESINAKKDKPDGEIFIVSKTQPWKYKTLGKLLETTPLDSQFNEKSIGTVFIIDGKLIKDSNEIQIDDSYFARATINKFSDISGVIGACQNMLLVQIDLLLTDPRKEIHIRGNEIPELENLLKQLK